MGSTSCNAVRRRNLLWHSPRERPTCREFAKALLRGSGYRAWPATLESNWISIYLPNLEELLFLTVLALPKASKIGLDSRTCCSTVFSPVCFCLECPPTKAR